MAANPQNKLTDLACKSTYKLLSSALTIATYSYSAWMLIVILPWYRLTEGKSSVDDLTIIKCRYHKPAKGRDLGSLGLCTTPAEAPPMPPPEGWGGWPPDRGVGGSNRAIHWLIRDSRSTVVRTDSDRMDIRWLLVCWTASLQWQADHGLWHSACSTLHKQDDL